MPSPSPRLHPPPPPPPKKKKKKERKYPTYYNPNRVRHGLRAGHGLRRGSREPLQGETQTWAESRLVQQVNDEVTKWIRVNRRARKRRRREKEEVFEKLLPDQLVLLLESLLEEKTLCPRILQSLEKMYHLREQDAEVRHRWCELVIKHKYTKAYEDIERFLLEDQAMGVYLYGELMVSENAKQQQLAHKCFEMTKEDMDRSSAKVVAEMLF